MDQPIPRRPRPICECGRCRPCQDRQYAAANVTNNTARPPVSTERRPVSSGPVTITAANGDVLAVLPALSAAKLRRLTRDRPPISPSLRARVLRRDRGACRYCGDDSGPFELDHVIPVAHGGPTRIHNLVTACRTCNSIKGANRWVPRPLDGSSWHPTEDQQRCVRRRALIEQATTKGHTVRVVPRRRRGAALWCSCSCGANAGRLLVASMAAEWRERHLLEESQP